MSALAQDRAAALVAITYAVAALITHFSDRFALPGKVARAAGKQVRPGDGLRDLAARLPAVALIYLFFFAISWRPLYALTGTASTFVVFTGISRAKYEFIREPLVFSDIALVLLVVRHRTLFYANWLNLGFWVVALGYVFGVSALFMIFEPAVLPASLRPLLIFGMVVLAAAPWLLLFTAGPRLAFARLAARVLGNYDATALTARLGTFAVVLYGFVAWLGGRRPVETQPHLPVRRLPGTSAARRAQEKPLLVVWQSESFMDMRHFGLALSMPNLDRLRRRAIEWGRMSSVFEGGYTLRTEFAVIAGLAPVDIGPDASHPYLRASTYAHVSWPGRFRRAGWSTRFIHPYDRRFFWRDRALPQLGFESLTMIDEFADHEHAGGPYVTDMALAERVLAFCRADADRPGSFVFAASMENHGPWQPGRHGGASAPLDIYLAILQRSDAALGHLADELDRLDRPVWLAFYGDHAPILKSFADPFPDPRTEYLIVPLSRAAADMEAPRSGEEKPPWRIIADMVRHAGLTDFVAGHPEAAR